MPTEPPGDPADRPPFWVKRARIRNYKSIAYCDVSLEPLTILVGRNGAGKSNFLDALAFLSDLVALRPQEAVERHGGRQAILHRGGDEPVEVGVQAEYRNDGAGVWDLDYTLALHGFASGRPLEVRDRLMARQPGHPPVGFTCDARGEVNAFGVPSGTVFRVDASTHASLLISKFRPTDAGFDVKLFNDRLAMFGVYNFVPQAIRPPQRNSFEVMLDRDGRNLAGALLALRSTDPESYERLAAYLGVVVPGVKDLQVVTYGGYHNIQSHVHAGGHDEGFDAASMSDGTLRATAALAAAFQVSADGTRPSLVGIEEPETSLHPAAMRALVDALDEATRHTQVLLTTHSADLLADGDIGPSKVRVVRRNGFRTEIAPVDAASREIVAKELYTLADLHRMDRLEPDEADLGRQQHPGSPGH